MKLPVEKSANGLSPNLFDIACVELSVWSISVIYYHGNEIGLLLRERDFSAGYFGQSFLCLTCLFAE